MGIRGAFAPGGTCPPSVVIYMAFSDASKVGLLVFLEFSLERTLELSSGCRCECACCGQYGWVQMDFPPQQITDEFGSLGTLRTMFYLGTPPSATVYDP
ncbi:hypothetical protein DEO72_LG10g2172 [Vigna unguiculata]|uniref:Uncharacterized protein n=1 Tax=Vigna unguiculata TaxID=3917 RepID=A0A4D6NEF2_VIGUN|nr:hypothetical protein DEO72_LG10g2172 [Vigna unguiculata]